MLAMNVVSILFSFAEFATVLIFNAIENAINQRGAVSQMAIETGYQYYDAIASLHIIKYIIVAALAIAYSIIIYIIVKRRTQNEKET